MTLKYNSKEYNIGLADLGLRVYSRNDRDSSGWGMQNKYIVAPVIRHGHFVDYYKVGWQVYYYDSAFDHTRKTMKRYKTKKEAIEAVREQVTHEPWYADLPGYDTPQGVYLSDGMYGHKGGRITDSRPNR